MPSCLHQGFILGIEGIEPQQQDMVRNHSSCIIGKSCLSEDAMSSAIQSWCVCVNEPASLTGVLPQKLQVHLPSTFVRRLQNDTVSVRMRRSSRPKLLPNCREAGSLRRILVPAFLHEIPNPGRNIIRQGRPHSTQDIRVITHRASFERNASGQNLVASHCEAVHIGRRCVKQAPVSRFAFLYLLLQLLQLL